jgi:FAD/FMN-containing dehydrogenase
MQTLEKIRIAGVDGGLVELTKEDLAGLASGMDGRILRAGDVGWDEAILTWNGMVAAEPAVVVQPETPQEVSAVIRFARDHQLRLSVKGGGHHIAGISIAARGLTLDMSRMRDVEVDPDRRIARVGAGCRLQDVDRATQEHGLATVLGFVSIVGVSGLTLGGGLGYLTRRFGWAVDNLLDVEIVTADGRIRRASGDENPDLFWAIRGAGANFGAVTRFTFRLHPVGPKVYGGLIAWPFERADEILKAYRAIAADAPRELSVWLVLLRAPAAPFLPEAVHGKRLLAMAVCYSGDLARTDEVMAPIRALDAPAFDLLHDRPYAQVQSYLDETEPKGMHYYWKTGYLSELPDELLSTARDLFADCPMPEGELGFLHLAGALNERDPDDGAVGNRDARYVTGIKGMWRPGEPAAREFEEWVREAWKKLRPFSTGGNYVNFQTADEDEARIRATYGPNFDRLQQLKAKYDPANLFRSNRNIPVTASALRDGRTGPRSTRDSR